jgi:TetR/AcrR family transcriptional regulator
MDNKENLLSTALKLFSSQGYESIGVQEIVESSGVTKPTMYHYFGSKQGLLEALLERDFAPLCGLVKEASEYNGDLTLNMLNTTRVFFDYVRKNKEFYRMQLAMCFASPESQSYAAVSQYNAKIMSMLEEMFLKASKDHGNMKGRHKRYAFTFLGIINNYITLYLGGHIKLSEETAFQAMHQFSHGIYS